MKTIQEFITENRISIKSEYADANKAAPDWKDANHYKVTLKYGRRQYTTYFSQGYGITGDPDAEGVLNCLALDSSGIENTSSFEGWCCEYGYDTDSRKAEKIFKVCERQAKKLKVFLGEHLYQQLLFNTESL